MCLYIHTLSLLLINVYSTCANERESDLDLSKDVASISKLAVEHSKIDPIDLNFGSKLISGLKHHEIVENVTDNYLPLDPVLEDVWFCKRDFSIPCPLDFILLTNTNDVTNPNGKCVPKGTYTGNCGAEDFSNTSIQYKIRWSARCGTNWPCDVKYRPDYGQPCPELWILKGGKCVPTFDYFCPCTQPISFIHYNTRQREEWSRACHAHWPNLVVMQDSNSGVSARALNRSQDIPIDSKNTHARLFN